VDPEDALVQVSYFLFVLVLHVLGVMTVNHLRHLNNGGLRVLLYQGSQSIFFNFNVRFDFLRPLVFNCLLFGDHVFVKFIGEEG